MKLSDVIKVRGIFLQIKDTKMPIKTSYQIARFLQRTDSDATFYSDKYRSIINECAELKEDGTPDTSEDGMNIKIREDKIQDCVTMIQELEATDVGDFALKIDVSDLENSGLTVEQLYILMDYIVE
mgnify:FL=1